MKRFFLFSSSNLVLVIVLVCFSYQPADAGPLADRFIKGGFSNLTLTVLDLSESFPKAESSLAMVVKSPSEARWSLAKKVFWGVAGFAAGKFIGHNIFGHHLAAKLTGTDISWSSPYWPDPRPRWRIKQEDDKTKRILVNSGGFLEQFISSEVILGWDKIPKDHPFTLGWLGWNFVDEVFYPIAHEINEGGYCDLKYLERDGVNIRLVETGLLLHAGSIAWRLWKGKEFPLFIKTTWNEVVIGIRGEW